VQKSKNSTIAKVSLLAAVLLAVMAGIMGTVQSHFLDPEASSPAPLMGFLAFFLGVASLIFNQRAKRQNQPTNKWVFKLAGLALFCTVAVVIIMFVGFVLWGLGY